MTSDHRCFFCFARAFEKLLSGQKISTEAKNRFAFEMINMFKDNWDISNTPEFARELHNILKGYSLDPDPYRKAKKESNDQALELIAEIRNTITCSEDPFKTALKASIAGNIMDFAACDSFDLNATLGRSFQSDFAIDHSRQLKESIPGSRSILFLGDNAGEIVFDKLFIEHIRHTGIIYVVRGAPVLNDATIEDAEYVRMGDVARVISNEYDAPSTILHKSGKIFRDYFEKADLIISKGQGNLEGLYHLNDPRIYFLLMVKCEVIAGLLRVPVNSFVVCNYSFIKTQNVHNL